MTTPPRRKPRTGENRLDPDDPRSRPSSPERGAGQSLIEHLEERLRCADDARVRAAVRSIVESPILEEFRARVAAYDRDHPEARKGEGPVAIPQREIRARIGEIPVGVLTRRARTALKCPTDAESTLSPIVRLSAETALKQLKHSDPGLKRPLTNDDYRLLPGVIEHGEMLSITDHELAFFLEVKGEWYAAVVKRTEDHRVYLKTFHRTKDRDRHAARRRAGERKSPK